MGNIVSNRPTINVDQFQLMPDSGSSIPTSLNEPLFDNQGKDIFRHSTFVAQSDDWTFEWNGPFLQTAPFVRFINYVYGFTSNPLIKLADLNFSAPLDSATGLSNDAGYGNLSPPNPFNFLPNGMDVTLTFGNKQNWISFMVRKRYLFSLQRPLQNTPSTYNSVFLTTQFTRYGGSPNDTFGDSLNSTPFSPPSIVLPGDSLSPYNQLLGGALFEDCLQLVEYDPTTDTESFLEYGSDPLDFTNILNNNTQLRLVVRTFPNLGSNPLYPNQANFTTGYNGSFNPDPSNRYTSTNNFKALIRLF